MELGRSPGLDVAMGREMVRRRRADLLVGEQVRSVDTSTTIRYTLLT
jgi:hypothetical protein